MTIVADSSSASADPPAGSRQPGRGRPPASPGRLVLAGLLAALRASVVGLAVCLLAGLLLTLSGAGEQSLAGVVGLGGDLWLAAHQVPLLFPHGPVSLLPLGLTLLPTVLLFRAGVRLASDVRVDGLRRAALAAATLAVPYAGAALLVAVATLAAPEHASMVWAPAAAATLVVIAGGVGVLRGGGLGLRAAALVPASLRRFAVASVGGAATLLAVGALLVAAMLAVRVIKVHEITGSLSAGGAGGALLFLAGAAYVPNAVVFAIGYAAGPGFSVGVGTLVAPGQVEAGAVPAFPLLAAVPPSAPPAAWLVLAGPALAGVVAGTLLVRHTAPGSLPRAALAGLVTGPLVGVAAVVACMLAGGSLGADRLASLGPAPLLVGGALTVEVGIVAAGAAVLATWWIRRRAADAHPLRANDL